MNTLNYKYEDQIHSRDLEGNHFMYRIFYRLGFRPGKLNRDVISATATNGNVWKRIFWKLYWRVN